MTFTTTLNLTAFASVTLAQAMADSNAPAKLGLSNNTLTSLLPGDADIVYTREFTLGAGLTKAINLETMQITDIDSTQPRNLDGNTFTLSKIYAIVLKFVSQVTPDVAAGIRLAKDTWPVNLDLTLGGAGGGTEGATGAVAFLFDPEGYTVDNTNNAANISETESASNVVVQLMVIGKD